MDQLSPLTGRLELTGWHSLPTEIRLRIYSFTWEPRQVFVDPKPTRLGFTGDLRVRSPPPVTLHLNFEAREATLRHYVPFFQDKAGKSVAYFNPAIDVLFLSFFWDFWPEYPETMVQVKQLCSILAVARHLVFTGGVLECEELRFRAALPEYKEFFPELLTIDHFERVAYTPGNRGVHRHDSTHLWFRSCCVAGCKAPKAPKGVTASWFRKECERDPWRLHLLKDCAHEGAPKFKMVLPSCEQILSGTTCEEILHVAVARVLA